MTDFVHLHLYSEYSLLDSALKVGRIPLIASALGQKAVALTDRSVLFGAVSIARACEKAGVKPIIGCEVNVAEGNASDRNARHHRLVLLCENNRGYGNLCRIVSGSFEQTGSPVPVTDRRTLAANSDGLIALSGGTDGEIAALISAGDREGAESAARSYTDIFGPDCFFIELQNHGIREERQTVRELYDLSVKLGIGCAATNSVRYEKPEDAYTLEVLRCIKNDTKITDSVTTGEYYFTSGDEMSGIFGGFGGAVENTVRIAARCSVTFETGNYHMPDYPVGPGETQESVLSEKTYAGLGKLFACGRLPAPGHTEKEYYERAGYELSVINGMGYAGYFLIVADYVNYARTHGIAVGPGRGSGCGSLAAFALAITDIDPLKYDLYFERFLNPERVSMPDIDIDFDYLRRNEVADYLTEKYGSDRVCRIVTFGTLAARAAIRDSARVLGVPAQTAEALSAALPSGNDYSVAEASESRGMRQLCARDESVEKILKTAEKIEGFPRSMSVHPAGIVIAPGPVSDFVPVAVNGGLTVTQYDMTTVEELGLLKFDLLSLRNLSVIDNACREIRRTEPDFDIEKIDLSDRASYDILCSGSTAGLFQLDQEGMRRVIRSIRPRSIEDIMTAIALYRPGPMDSIPKYIAGRKDPSSVTYPHELLREVLEPTCGCIIYQEQVMSIFRIMAGYTAGGADLVRRAMSKKKASALEAERERFTKGAADRGMSGKDALKLFDDMTSFAGYAFNRSHAAAYAMVTFRTAYLKAHYPGCFFAALLNSVGNDTEKMGMYIAEAEKSGIMAEKPDINSSGAGFVPENGKIIFSLSAIKGIGSRLAQAVSDGRREGKYRSLQDFLTRAGGRELTQKSAEALCLCGAMDSLGPNRPTLMKMISDSMSRSERAGSFNPEGQMDIFSAADPEAGETYAVPDLPDMSDAEKIKYEKMLTGFAFTRPAVPRETASRAIPRTAPPAVRILYVRVPSEHSEIYSKCVNLAGIFDGPVPLSFYFADTGKYVKYAGGIAYSEYVRRQFSAEAGEDSVIPR